MVLSEIVGGWGCIHWYSRLVSDGECIGGRGSVVTGWGRLEGRSEDREESGWEGAKRVVGREINGFQHSKRRKNEGGKNKDNKIVIVN
jgi:hypothetical protein